MPRNDDNQYPLTKLESMNLARQARDAANKAVAEKRTTLVPRHDEASRSDKRDALAKYIRSLGGLERFYGNHIASIGHLTINLRTVSGVHSINVRNIGGFNDLVDELTKCFVTSSFTDEPHELATTEWTIVVPDHLANERQYGQQEFKHKKGKAPKVDTGFKTRGLQLAISSAHLGELKELYKEVYERTWAEGEQRILTSKKRDMRKAAQAGAAKGAIVVGKGLAEGLGELAKMLTKS